MKNLTGAKIVIESLIQENVKVIFGYPGGAVLPIYDELFKQKKIRHILVRHCLLYTSPSPRDTLLSRMPSSA